MKLSGSFLERAFTLIQMKPSLYSNGIAADAAERVGWNRTNGAINTNSRKRIRSSRQQDPCNATERVRNKTLGTAFTKKSTKIGSQRSYGAFTRMRKKSNQTKYRR